MESTIWFFACTSLTDFINQTRLKDSNNEIKVSSQTIRFLLYAFALS